MESIKRVIFYLWCLALYVVFAIVQVLLPLLPTPARINQIWRRLRYNATQSRLRQSPSSSSLSSADPEQPIDTHSRKRRVVVVGGGFTGVTVAKELEDDPEFEVVLLDPKKYFEFTPSLLRTFVDPAHTGVIQIEFQNFLSQTKIINQNVVEITRESVVTETKQQLPYDYLVMATGSSYAPVLADSGIISGRDCPPMFNHNAVKIQKAQKILIVGGGIVGVELAGEIIEKYPNKQLVIVTSSDRLIPRSPAKAIRHAEQFFRSRGVQLIFNERLERNTNNQFVTSRGTTIESDLAFMCIGIQPNSHLLKPHFGATLNDKGFINVNPQLQLEGVENVFSAGDLVSILEEKLAQSAQAGARVIAENIRRLAMGCRHSSELKSYSPFDWPMLISLGKLEGVMVWKSFSVAGFIPALMKEAVEWKELIHYY